MDISIESQANGSRIVRLSGRLDLVSAPALKEQITGAIAPGENYIVLDLADVSFIDSSGLGAIIGGLRAAREAGGDLRIARPPEQARTILSLTTLDRVLTPFESVEAALDRA